jgi:1-aminocyclopropane-1-carboxylate deaminase/D-cysteine desulfhydrase-like pyridoxal-dependent ACC family enzyme
LCKHALVGATATESDLLLASLPTPLQLVEHAGKVLWVKRDDATSTRYGGNKARKLGHYLLQARARGKHILLTVGAAGSHHVLATAVHGQAAGLQVEAVLMPQHWTTHAERNLRGTLGAGTKVHCASNYVHAALVIAKLRARASALWVPLGGSSAKASVGYADAAHECARQLQIQRSAPFANLSHVVALGSGGTAAGLAVGLWEAAKASEERCGRLFAVAISGPVWALRASLYAQILAVARERGHGLRAAARIWANVVVVGSELGDGYGIPSAGGNAAADWAQGAALETDATYTSKALAFALARASSRAPSVVYWHTLADSARAAPLFADAPPLRPEVRGKLFPTAPPR